MDVPRIAIVIGSTRPGRVGEAVGKWVHEQAATRTDARFELVDLADQGLPLLDEPVPPSQGKYSKEHTKRWSALVDGFDGFVFVTPEYNHGTSAALKNALDFLYKEWNNKAAGFVGYGSMMGARAVESLRTTLAELQMATVRQQVGFSLRSDFEDGRFKPGEHHGKVLHKMLDQLLAWTKAMRTVREPVHAAPARPPRPDADTRATHAGQAA